MKKRKAAPGILFILLLALVSWVFWDAGITLAVNSTPDVVLNISGDGSSGGAMFSGGLWAPGMTQKGIMRIYNNHSERVNVHSLGLHMELKKGDVYEDTESEEEIENDIFESFAKNMKLTIKKGRLLVFSDTIFDGSFFDMLYEAGSETYRGYELPLLDRFNINAGDSADLEYTVHMDEQAGNDMQGLKATVAFLVNVEENPVPGHKDKRKDSELLEEPIEEYPDIGGHWAHDCIVALLQHAVIRGYPDGTIRPENYITRAEAAILIGKALKFEDNRDAILPYEDNIPDWVRGYVASTTEIGIFEGYPGNIFVADGFITREEMVAALIRAFDIKETGNIELTFKDKDQIGDWAKEYIRAAVANNIVTGYPGNEFRAKAEITRAEAFTMICKLLGYHSEHNQ